MKFCKTCGGFFDEELETCPDDGSELVELQQEQDEEDPLIGQVLDKRYRVLSRLGLGGMGAVYRAMQTTTRREVALKVIRGDIAQDGTKRFMVEAHTTSALRNVHTVTIFDFGQAEGGVLYLAMELLEGRPLDNALKHDGAMPWPRALRIAAQIAESLVEAHDKGIVHRDLKPANVFLTPMGDDPDFVKVLDFGIAKLQHGGMTTNLTGTGMVLGTPRYMSPEQARAQVLDARTDVYSLGIMLYEMLAGQPPFDSDHPLSLMMKHCQEPAPPLAQFHPEPSIPGSLQALLDGSLAKDRNERIASAIAFGDKALGILGTGGGDSLIGLGSLGMGEGGGQARMTGQHAGSMAMVEAATVAAAGVSTGSGPACSMADEAVVGGLGVAKTAATPSVENEALTDFSAQPVSISARIEGLPSGERPPWRVAAAVLGLLLLLGGGGFVLMQVQGDEERAATGPQARAEGPGDSIDAGRADRELLLHSEGVHPGTAAVPGSLASGSPGAADAAPGPGSPAVVSLAAASPAPGSEAPGSGDGPGEASGSASAQVIEIQVDGGPATVTGPSGQSLGTTPLILPSPKNSLTITLTRDGYRSMDFTLAPGTLGQVRLDLERLRRRKPRRGRRGQGRKGKARRGKSSGDASDDLLEY